MDGGVEANFDLCRETFVQFDLHIDLLLIKEVWAAPTISITGPGMGEGPGAEWVFFFNVHPSAMSSNREVGYQDISQIQTKV